MAFWAAGLLCLVMSVTTRWLLKNESSRGVRLWFGGGLLVAASLALWGAGLAMSDVDLSGWAMALGIGGLVLQVLAVRHELSRPLKAMQAIVAGLLLLLPAMASRPFLQNEALSWLAVWASALGHLAWMGLLLSKLQRRVFHLTAQPTDQTPVDRRSGQMLALDLRQGLSGVAASLAHELSQPLTNLYLITDRLELELQDQGDGVLRQCVQDLHRNTQKAGDLLGRIRSVGQSAKSQTEDVPLERVIAVVIRLVRDEARHQGVHFRVSVPTHSLCVQGNMIELTFIVMNVLRNAAEATEGQAQRHVGICLRREGQMAHLTVTDNGPGMTAEVLGQVGTAFFSTKPQGMGVGLTISKSMAKRHGGRLLMGNHPSGGASIELQWPAPEAMPEASPGH